jgi:hypothetical protein
MRARHHQQSWPSDLTLFAVLAAVWSLTLFVRALSPLPLGYLGDPMQAVMAGIKFRGGEARIVTVVHAALVAVFAGGMLARRRWGVVLALFYMVEVVLSHLVFILAYLDVRSESVHVRMAAFEGPTLVLILLYLWIRSRDLLFGSGHHA